MEGRLIRSEHVEADLRDVAIAHLLERFLQKNSGRKWSTHGLQ